LKRALQVDGVIRGLHEVSKYVEACKAQVVFLAESCSWASMAAMAAMAHVVFVGGTDRLRELLKLDYDGL
jgi:ribosomal protein L7Ae-like RNA K-turn-binding protein